MAEKEHLEQTETLKKLDNIHYCPGPIHQRTERIKALKSFETDELEAIYHLVESHVPSLRIKTVLRYEKFLITKSDNHQLSLCKSNVASNCTNMKMSDRIDAMLEKVKEMPPEWTIVQLTPSFSSKENVEINTNKYYTNSLYITVFNCGHKQPKPFCVHVKVPSDSAGTPISLVKEMQAIIASNKNILISPKGQYFKDLPDKDDYFNRRQTLDNRLKLLVKDLQELYLREWRCLLMGKYVKSDLEECIQKRIEEFFKNEAPLFKLDDKTKCILQYLVKSANYLKLTEMKKAIETTCSKFERKIQKDLVHVVRGICEEFSLPQEKRHPLILIIDDNLDCFPWEMIDILNDSPVSRLPSLHLAYALYKEHKTTIKDGFKIIENPQNGTYLVNPDLDLKSMQNRITSFFEYWIPSWKGLAGIKPTEEQFEKMLVTADIFSYNGHGSGSHYFSSQKIEKTRINAVVLLFGCGSTKLSRIGPQTEMYGTYQTYLIACSPCIVGMLWEVTDVDTDVLTTQLLSHWIPNSTKTHWKFLDKKQWKKGEKVEFTSENLRNQLMTSFEPELLRVLNNVKQSNSTCFYMTKAACVARGIPVKIV